MASDINKFHFRLVLLGANGTGKTAILNRFLFKKFDEKYKPTVEDLFSKEFDLGIIELKVDFLDTSGSMQFPAMRRLSITTGDAFLIVYALDDDNSYEVVKLYMAEIQEIRSDFQEIPIVFVGNKSDLPREQRKVPKEMVSNYVYYELPRIRTKVIECSCKEDVNIENIFRAYLSLARVSTSSSQVIISQNNSHHSHHNSLTNKKRPASAIPPSEINSSHKPPPPPPPPQSQPPMQLNSKGEQDGGGGGDEQPPTGNKSTFSNSTCATSIKMALGVRKSCDASIVTSMRKVSLTNTASSRNSREQLLEPMSEVSGDQHEDEQPQGRVMSPNWTNVGGGGGGVVELQQPQNNNNNRIGNGNGNGAEQAGRRFNQKSSIESLLKEAKQQQQQLNSKLSVGNQAGAKPRSRSLIWRPHRKSSRSAQNDSSECRVT